MQTNFVKGENDGTVAGKIGRDLFAAVSNYDSDSRNPMRKSNGYTARVLLFADIQRVWKSCMMRERAVTRRFCKSIVVRGS